MANRSASKPPKATRSQRIMNAALKIFAAKGVQEATVAEISKTAGVSEATVYEHFGTKEDLLFAIPEQVTIENIETMENILPYIKGAEARIRAVLFAYLKLYRENPDYSALVLIQLAPNKRFRDTKAYAAVRKAANMLLSCIREGIEDMSFRDDIDPILIRSMLLGTIEHLMVRWLMQGASQDEPILDRLDPLLEVVFNGIRRPEPAPGLTLTLAADDIQKFRDLITGGNP